LSRTPLTYYGGKQRLARQIVALMPSHRVYLEPFAGGAAVLFAKPRAERETLNDLDGLIVRFWRALRDRPEELAAAVAQTPYSRAEWMEHSRARWRPALADVDDDVEAARRLLVSIDQSFSRQECGWSPPSILFDRRGRWQPGVWANLPDKIVAAATRLQGVALEHADALELIPRWDVPESVIYCDPPYALHTRRAQDRQYVHDDDGALWSRLVEVLRPITRAAVILSGYPCPEADELGWRMVPLTHTLTAAVRAGDKVRDAPEALWLSPAVPEPALALFGSELA
jgi:DNA adenine methylase